MFCSPYVIQLTLEAINKEEESVALQGIEFWSTICEEETCLLEEIAEVCYVACECSIVCLILSLLSTG